MKKTALLIFIGSILMSLQSCQKENLVEDAHVMSDTLVDTRNASESYADGEIIIRYDEEYTEEEKVILRDKYASEVGFNLNFYETCIWDNRLELWKVSKDDGSGDVNVNDLVTSMGTQEFDEGDLEEHVNTLFAQPNHGDYIPTTSSAIEDHLLEDTDGPLIAIIDTGVDYGAIGGNFLAPSSNSVNADEISGWNFVNNDNEIMDDFGHGTHVLNIIQTELKANNVNAQYISLKAFNENGNGRLFDLLKALAYVNANDDIDVVNMSLGWNGVAKKYKILEDLINEIAEHTLIVCSSGNEGENVDSDPHLPSGFSNSNIISVGGFTKAIEDITIENGIVNGLSLAPLSNFGKKTVDIAAPFDEYKFKYPNNSIPYDLEGTSFSAGFITAKAAALFSSYSNPGMVKKQLLSTSYKALNLSGKIGKGNVFLKDEE